MNLLTNKRYLFSAPLRVGLIPILMLMVFLAQADTLKIAVASNFYHALSDLSAAFNTQTGHEIRISSASSGQLYAQIQQAAPYDVFMSADMDRPRQLVMDKLASQAQVYAIGQLVILGNHRSLGCADILNSDALKYLAIANPDLAPYGAAAKAYLIQQNQWSDPSFKIVMGENVVQAMQFVASGNAQAGLVAKSLLINQTIEPQQCMQVVASDQYPPIEQGMVFISASEKHQLYTIWTEFLHSQAARDIISKHGYLTAEVQP